MVTTKLSSKKKMRNTLFITFLILICLIGRLGYIQLVQGKELSELAYEQQTLDRSINPKRGTIYDTNGTALAVSSTVETVTVNPGNIAKENILSYTCRLNGVSDHFDSGNQRKTYRFSCNVITETQEYVMSFEYDYKNEFDNSTLGINSLSIFVNGEEKIKVDME